MKKALILILSVISVQGQINIFDLEFIPNVQVTTIAGSDGPAQVDGPGPQAKFLGGEQIAAYESGVFVASGNALRNISNDGTVTTLSELTRQPTDMQADAEGRLYFLQGNAIKSFKIGESISVVAGVEDDPWREDGPIATARFLEPVAIAIEGHTIYVFERRAIRKIINGLVETIAGSGQFARVDGKGVTASFKQIYRADFSILGEGIVVELESPHALRSFSASGLVLTLTNAPQVSHVAINAEGTATLFAYENPTFLQLSKNGTWKRLAGAGPHTQIDDIGRRATFESVTDISIAPDGDVLVMDKYKVRKISAPPLPPPQPASISTSMYAGVTISGTVGRTYRIEATPNLEDINTWTTIAIVVLPKSPYIWFDESPLRGKRFYRVVAE